MTQLSDIESRCKAYAERRIKLSELMAALHAAVAAVKRQHLAAIKNALGQAAAREADLRALVEQAPELFIRPRTVIFHGVKVGYVKGKGIIEICDRTRTVALIRRYLPDQAETLIRVEEVPHKPALAQLSVADLKRVGCSVVETGDEIVVKAVDSEVDKMVETLLRDAVDAVESPRAAAA